MAMQESVATCLYFTSTRFSTLYTLLYVQLYLGTSKYFKVLNLAPDICRRLCRCAWLIRDIPRYFKLVPVHVAIKIQI